MTWVDSDVVNQTEPSAIFFPNLHWCARLKSHRGRRRSSLTTLHPSLYTILAYYLSLRARERWQSWCALTTRDRLCGRIDEWAAVTLRQSWKEVAPLIYNAIRRAAWWATLSLFTRRREISPLPSFLFWKFILFCPSSSSSCQQEIVCNRQGYI